MGPESAEAVGGASLAVHGSTFHAAHLVLGKEAARGVHLLYGFCRYIDDVADEQAAEDARIDLDAVRADLESGGSNVPEVAGFLRFCAEHRVDPRVTEEFIVGVEQDLTVSTYTTEGELLRYCFRVASTVGLFMCSLFDVDDPAAHPFAIDLGIGMQLTNVCRDVLEDASRGRIYLPEELLGGPVDVDALAARDADSVARARSAVERLLHLAEGYYRSADEGMRFLPRRARLAVLCASRGYEAIGPRILAYPAEDGLPQRAYVGSLGKTWHFARAVAFAARLEVAALLRGAAPHRPELHTALAGLPGIDPLALR